MFVDFRTWTACFKTFHSNSKGLGSGLLLSISQKKYFFCFNHCLVEWLYFLLSFRSQMNTFSFSCWICRIHSSIKYCTVSWSWGCKTGLNHDTCHHFSQMGCSVWSSSNILLLIQTRKFYFGLIVHRTFFQHSSYCSNSLHMVFSKQ